MLLTALISWISIYPKTVPIRAAPAALVSFPTVISAAHAIYRSLVVDTHTKKRKNCSNSREKKADLDCKCCPTAHCSVLLAATRWRAGWIDIETVISGVPVFAIVRCNLFMRERIQVADVRRLGRVFFFVCFSFVLFGFPFLHIQLQHARALIFQTHTGRTLLTV